ncbi:hypothetical protein CWE08_02945 [Aliidiomarina iranensis]|uniref:Cytoskeleton protein RodZ-like C-terminal domain-containing protein n=1 Tax=Aliidiomarina iranensis TaxID=1434071 RepID=A0A432W329_9GAMM|nr:RodZ domain-containing protein [Aliidiomarina iranensis]RUO23618.1 hypothetical protein CWE08_02945 [Aliidiomarina iranensis]
MTNKNESDSDLQPEVVEELISQRPTPGELLRSGREAMGLSVGQVADRLRLRQQQIQELEDDVFTAHVSGTYIRGYLRSYAKLLQLDEGEVLSAYEHLAGDQKPKGQMQSFSRKTSIETQDNRLMFFTWIVVLILVGSVAVFVWQQFTADRDQAASGSIESSLEAISNAQQEVGQQDQQDSRSTDTTPADAELGNVDQGNVAQGNGGQASSATYEPVNNGDSGANSSANESNTNDLSTEGARAANAEENPLESMANNAERNTENTDLAAAQVAAVESEEPGEENSGSQLNTIADNQAAVNTDTNSDVSAAQLSNQAEVQQALAETANPAELGELVLVFAGDSWIRIEDGSGEAIAYGVKAGGYVMPLNGVTPYELTLGAPSVVTVYFRGEPVDLSEFSGGRIARFSLPRN